MRNNHEGTEINQMGHFLEIFGILKVIARFKNTIFQQMFN